MLGRVVAVVSVAAVLGTGCGRDDGDTGDGTARGAIEHIHGLGVDPRDQALYIATHRGLLRLGHGDQEPRWVGDERQGTMALAVVEGGRFLVSGHPEDGAGPPHTLGLRSSGDAGRTWRDVSLRGNADFHVLATGGHLVYGYDAGGGRLLVSSDRGRTWSPRRLPATVVDLALAPERPERVAASTSDGVFASEDRGRSWRRLVPGTGLLLWADGLYLIDAQGILTRTRDHGRSWSAVGNIDGVPVATTTHRGALYVATEDGRILRSDDRGGTWRRLLVLAGVTGLRSEGKGEPRWATAMTSTCSTRTGARRTT